MGSQSVERSMFLSQVTCHVGGDASDGHIIWTPWWTHFYHVNHATSSPAGSSTTCHELSELRSFLHHSSTVLVPKPSRWSLNWMGSAVCFLVFLDSADGHDLLSDFGLHFWIIFHDSDEFALSFGPKNREVIISFSVPNTQYLIGFEWKRM